MATQEDVKKWFDTCFRPCFINKYNTFIDRHNGKGKNYKNGQTQKENNLPIDCGCTYNPDVVLEDKCGKISYIVIVKKCHFDIVNVKLIMVTVKNSSMTFSKNRMLKSF
jgi:hypothetical protein